MGYVMTILSILFAVLVIYITKRCLSSEIPFKKPIVTPAAKGPPIPKPVPVSEAMTNPFVIFNSVSVKVTLTIPPNTLITDNFYIVSGTVALFYDATADGSASGSLAAGRCAVCQCQLSSSDVSGNSEEGGSSTTAADAARAPRGCPHVRPISRLGAGCITHSCFDLVGLRSGVVKMTASECRVAAMPEGDPLVNTTFFEKCCVEPLFGYFGCFDKLAELEKFYTADFGGLIRESLRLPVELVRRAYGKGERIRAGSEIICVESGCVRINGVRYEEESVFGYFGFIFSIYGQNRQGISIVAETDTVVVAAGYGAIKTRPCLDPRIFMRNKKVADDVAGISDVSGSLNVPSTPAALDVFTVTVGASSQWIRLQPDQVLLEKETVCEEVFLVDGREIGNKECIRRAPYTEAFISDKKCDALRIPRETVSTAILSLPHFHLLFVDKIFAAPSHRSKLVLITPVDFDCSSFVARLLTVLGSSAVLVNRRDILHVLHGQRIDRLGELILSNYLNRLRNEYEVVIVYMENEWSRMLRLFSRLCDLIYLVGREPVPNRFANMNVEFIQLHETRQGPPRISVRLRRLLFAAGESSSSEEEAEEETREEDCCNSTEVNAPLVDLYPAAHGNFSETELNGGDSHAQRGRPVRHGSKTAVGSGGISRDPLSHATTAFYYKRIHHILCPAEFSTSCLSDLERLSRYLLNRKIGLVLGGGGARGFAHVGIIRALEEENIPIDCVGGTSMGSFVGALYAQHLDFMKLYSECRKFAKQCGSPWNILIDLTYPFVALTSGRMLDRTLRSIFSGAKMQNLWIEFYCVTTNLLKQEERVQFNGSVWKWVRASMSICGFLPPVIINGEYFLDGAYMNNVPADVMASLNTQTVIACDVSGWPNTPLDEYDSKSGFFLLFKHATGYKTYLSYREMQYRLAFLSTDRKLKMLSSNTLLIRPDLSAYKTNDFKKFDEIVAAGYEAAKAAIQEWRGRGLLGTDKRPMRRRSI